MWWNSEGSEIYRLCSLRIIVEHNPELLSCRLMTTRGKAIGPWEPKDVQG
jgi:hypothetical protein